MKDKSNRIPCDNRIPCPLGVTEIECKKCKTPKHERECPVQKDRKSKRGAWCYECKRNVEALRYAARSE